MRLLGPTFGGINLEDIKAPECFVIEQALRERMSIPVFHDDQHGTAIISGAGLINALELTGRSARAHVKVVLSTAPAPPAIACVELLRPWACRTSNVTLCDTHGRRSARAGRPA